MAKKDKSKVNVVNPSKMTKEEVEKLTIETEQQQKKIDEQIKRAYKKIRGKLWLWWLLPIFGWLIYTWIYTSRLNNQNIKSQMEILKRAAAEKQLQLMLNKKRIIQLEEQ